MSIRYKVLLQIPGKEDEPLIVRTFSLMEGYSSGWSGAVVLAWNTDDPIGLGDMLGAAWYHGIVPGAALSVNLVVSLDEGDPDYDTYHGLVARTWPCMVRTVQPIASQTTLRLGRIRARVVDPVTWLADRPVWGAYRVASLAEIVGGALSLAAGGDGKPSTEPLLPRLPRVRIVANLRDELAQIPYAIAAGETLGAWLDRLLATLGVRIEMLGTPDGEIILTLSDRPPASQPIEMQVNTAQDPEDGWNTAEEKTLAPIDLIGLSVRRGTPTRAVVLDDPVAGGCRVMGYGTVGTVVTGVDVGLEEAYRRMRFTHDRGSAERIALETRSVQPGLRPGRAVHLDRPVIGGIQDWQIAGVLHHSDMGTYANTAQLLSAAWCWRPPAPRRRSPALVTGVIDAGEDHIAAQPVARDRMGRIPIAFPFSPTAMGQEKEKLDVADANADGRIDLDDFDAADVADYEERAAWWDQEAERYASGEYDPIEDDGDEDEDDEDEDDEDEAAERAARREAALRYIAYREAAARNKQDTDRDGFVTDLDTFETDDELEGYGAEGPDDEDERARWEAYQAEKSRAERDAATASEQWPVRIPLTVVQPMAGALHGFIAAHRQGDTCEIAVHEPLWAEIIGFQYRSDRRINPSLADATAGLVVEHNAGDVWSGMVFRPTDAVEDGSEGHGAGG